MSKNNECSCNRCDMNMTFGNHCKEDKTLAYESKKNCDNDNPSDCGESLDGETHRKNCDSVMPEDWFMDYVLSALDMNEFGEGVKEYSKICGKISALMSLGIDPVHALAYISECDDREITYKNNLEIAKIQADAQISTAKCSMAASLS